MPYYAVASGRSTGVYDNWEDCKDQVHGYSHNKFKKFDTPDQAWDFVDQHSSNAGQSFNTNSKAIACRGNNQVALRNYHGEVSRYQRTDYTEGKTLSLYANVFTGVAGMEMDILSKKAHVLTGKIIIKEMSL